MRFLKSWRYARGTSLLAMGILLCTGAFLCLLPTELDVSAALTTPHSHHLDQGTNEGYLAAVALEEAQDADGRPVNAADLLSALVLAVCFGAIVGWLLVNGRGQRAFRFVGLDHHRLSFFSAALEDRSFLGVFRR
jgi:hypothetical protein